jgi:two-component sensor histidine kinase
MINIIDLCRTRTALSDEDIRIIEQISRNLQIFADVSHADVFIDCPVPDNAVALVVAQASPTTAKSLYKSSVVGQTALPKNEPAVLFCLTSGKPVIGSRGISQEGTVVQQSVVPIKNAKGDTIGTLIVEEDITEKVEQEKNVEMLIETTEHLSETLLQVAMSESKVPSLMHEGIILFDYKGIISYANSRAYELLKQIGYQSLIKGQLIDKFFYGKFSKEIFEQNGGMIVEEMQDGKTTLSVKAVSIYRKQTVVGGIILLRDISDIKEKDKQLMIKSAVIKEIHHRVKNNLQTIASLLRLQMRRTDSTEIEKIYRESINRINSIAIIHEFLAHEGLELIDFKEVVEKIAKTIISSMSVPDQTISFTISGDSVFLQSDKASSLALIVTELIQNCVIHAFKERLEGHIGIQITKDIRQVKLSVIDNGSGIGYEGNNPVNGHLGLTIVETLVREDLEGTLEFRDTGVGTEVSIEYPISEGDSNGTQDLGGG